MSVQPVPHTPSKDNAMLPALDRFSSIATVFKRIDYLLKHPAEREKVNKNLGYDEIEGLCDWGQTKCKILTEQDAALTHQLREIQKKLVERKNSSDLKTIRSSTNWALEYEKELNRENAAWYELDRVLAELNSENSSTLEHSGAFNAELNPEAKEEKK